MLLWFVKNGLPKIATKGHGFHEVHLISTPQIPRSDGSGNAFDEVSQIILDMKSSRAIGWHTATLLYDQAYGIVANHRSSLRSTILYQSLHFSVR